jgi:hydrogenase maturation protease
MTPHAVVIGIGNGFRRDDGVGLVVAEQIGKHDRPGVRVMTAIGEPAAILDAWTGVALAVGIDAAMGEGSTPGRIRRWTPTDTAASGLVSSHAFGLPQTYALGQALGRIPDQLVVFTVEIADAGYGPGLTPAVAAAVPTAVEAVLTELDGGGAQR